MLRRSRRRKTTPESGACPTIFEGRPEHPKPQHVPKPMPEREVNKAVSDDLPDEEVENRQAGNEREIQIHPIGDGARPEGPQKKKYGCVDRQQPDHRPGKRRELNVISRPRPRKVAHSCSLFLLAVDTETHRSGKGTTGRLRWPSASTALTAKMTLSFESFIVMRRTLPTFWTCSQSGLVVARQRTS